MRGAQARHAAPTIATESGIRLPLDLEADFNGYLKFLNGAVHDPAALIYNLEPIHVTDRFRSLGDARLHRFCKADGRGPNQFDNLVCSRHLPQYTPAPPAHYPVLATTLEVCALLQDHLRRGACSADRHDDRLRPRGDRVRHDEVHL